MAPEGRSPLEAWTVSLVTFPRVQGVVDTNPRRKLRHLITDKRLRDLDARGETPVGPIRIILGEARTPNVRCRRTGVMGFTNCPILGVGCELWFCRQNAIFVCLRRGPLHNQKRHRFSLEIKLGQIGINQTLD